ncbi:heat shock protein Hsp20 [Litchfieldella anticariensis FP35 = DSM 16096]|uniref:Heat shock protein Hsp20 n=1 Tax=Litchfieldella anticariensis (strain DSM 16096 / CECT 5854 / CIP 108499 / LMG 22089 / FP35) TaxID=1121939 RepID=S2KE52_LITA3|nr:Hsp20/alpha crystallin family protein [Halomonas anticariensis]EPC00457.1 heat shock protein Hsp20 [Halomonas anticariensis FP35 = DSM 16096]
MAKKNVKEIKPSASETSSASTSQELSPFREFDRMFDRFFDRDWMHPLRWEHPLLDRLAAVGPRVPKVDIVDRDSELVVRAEIPGVAREDLDVSVTDNSVTIKGESHKESKEESGEYYRCEISHGSVTRTVTLPCEVDADKAEASFSDGILELTLPKIKEAHRRKLEIK